MVTDRGMLRKLLEEKDILVTIGVGDALSAKIASAADGVDAILSSGFTIAANALGLPDAELYSRSDNVYAVQNMVYVSDKPIIADIDTGYGNAVTVIKTVHEFERAGAQGVIIEDQISPKRCPICVGDVNTTISAEEAAGKIRAAAENRLYPETVIIARTDASDMDEILRRCRMYIEAGADLVQPTSKPFKGSKEMYKEFVKRVDFPVSMIVCGWLDGLTKEDILDIKPKIAQFALVPINFMYPVIKEAVKYVGENMTQVGLTLQKADHSELVSFLGMPDSTDKEKKYLKH